MINFCFDKTTNHEYVNFVPNLITNVYINQCAVTYPYVDYPRLLEYLDQEHIKYNIHPVDNCPTGSFYFININYFDHSVDWFQLMPLTTLKAVKDKKIKVLFFYCEGDAPHIIRETLHRLANKHNVDPMQIHFICHTTVAETLKNFYYFNDDEILFKNAQNYSKSQALWHDKLRSKKFTCLIRSHKSWRLVAAADFYANGLHKDSYTSYNKISYSDGFDHTDNFTDPPQNPLWNGSYARINSFKKIIPFSADVLTDDEHNNYETFVEHFYTDAYWNIVVETHINLSGTTGTFITEKTWKPIRHNQPFIILGTVGSIKHLQELGYHTFDGIIDESYDYIKNDSLRYEKVQDVILNLNSKSYEELHEINHQIKPIVEHNSKLFNSSKKHRLEKLINNLLSDP